QPLQVQARLRLHPNLLRCRRTDARKTMVPVSIARTQHTSLSQVGNARISCRTSFEVSPDSLVTGNPVPSSVRTTSRSVGDSQEPYSRSDSSAVSGSLVGHSNTSGSPGEESRKS